MNKQKKDKEIHERVAVCRQLERWGIARILINRAIGIYGWDEIKDWAFYAAININDDKASVFVQRFPTDDKVNADYLYFFGGADE